MLLSAGSASATSYTVSNSSVSAEADFSLSSGSLSLTLSNLKGNPTSAAQLISGIKFDVAGSSLSGSGNLTTANSGEISDITTSGPNSGSYTAGTSDILTRWEATYSAATIHLTTLTGGQPNELIIGPDDSGNFDPTLGGLYSNANSSINNFNSSVLGSATFDITIPGLTSASQISGVVFEFGTGPDSTISVPDGGTTALLLGAALTVMGLIRRKLG